MKFTISRQELNHVIRKIQNITPQHAPIPILSHCLIEAQAEDELVFTATDLVLGARCRVKAKVHERGALSLPSKKFFQLMRELTDSYIELTTTEGEMAEIQAGSSSFRLHGMRKELYPEFPDLTAATRFTVESEALRGLFYRTVFAAAREESRYMLSGLLLRIENGRAVSVGTDTKRLAKSEINISLPPSDAGEYILPLKAVDECIKLLTEDKEATVYLTKNKMAMESGNTILTTKLLSGNYPDFEQLIPKHDTKTILIHREELMSLLRQISLFADDATHSVRFIFNPGELVLRANLSAFGEGKVSMPIDYQGPPLEIAFGALSFLDALRHSKDETLPLKIFDAHNPGMMTDSTRTLFIIMPMYLET